MQAHKVQDQCTDLGLWQFQTQNTNEMLIPENFKLDVKYYPKLKSC